MPRFRRPHNTTRRRRTNNPSKKKKINEMNLLDMIIFNNIADGTNLTNKKIRRNIAKKYIKMCEWDFTE